METMPLYAGAVFPVIAQGKTVVSRECGCVDVRMSVYRSRSRSSLRFRSLLFFH